MRGELISFCAKSITVGGIHRANFTIYRKTGNDMKTRLLLCVIMALWVQSSAQVALSEDFTTTIPASWTAIPATGVSWQHGNFGTGNSGCAMIYGDTANGTKYLQAPSVDLSQMDKPYLSFRMAVVKENFILPRISLQRATTNGWQILSAWGEGFGEIPMKYTYDIFPPLNDSNISWMRVSFDLSSLPDSTDVKLAFAVEFSNGGWALVDSVRIYDAAPVVYSLPYQQGFETDTFMPKDWLEHNTDQLNMWERNTNIGAYGNSNSCAYIDNYNNTPATQGSAYAMRTVWVDLQGATKPFLQFDYAYAMHQINPESDILSIMYLYPGANWTELVRYDSADLTTANNTQAMFTPADTDWKTRVVDLSQFVGSPSVRFAISSFSYNSGNNALYIDNVIFADSATVSVKKIKSRQQLKIYPNPAQEQLYIDMKNISTIRMYDITGREVQVPYAEKDNRVVVGVSSLGKGVYMLHVEADGIRTTRRVLIE